MSINVIFKPSGGNTEPFSVTLGLQEPFTNALETFVAQRCLPGAVFNWSLTCPDLLHTDYETLCDELVEMKKEDMRYGSSAVFCFLGEWGDQFIFERQETPQQLNFHEGDTLILDVLFGSAGPGYSPKPVEVFNDTKGALQYYQTEIRRLRAVNSLLKMKAMMEKNNPQQQQQQQSTVDEDIPCSSQHDNNSEDNNKKNEDETNSEVGTGGEASMTAVVNITNSGNVHQNKNANKTTNTTAAAAAVVVAAASSSEDNGTIVEAGTHPRSPPTLTDLCAELGQLQREKENYESERGRIQIEKDKCNTELGQIKTAIMQLRTQEKKWNAELCRLHTDEDKLMNVQKRNDVQFAHVMEEIDRYYNTPSQTTTTQRTLIRHGTKRTIGT